MLKILPKTGDRFYERSKLTYIGEDLESSSAGNRRAFFLCGCGNLKSILFYQVRYRKTISCGCYTRKVSNSLVYGIGIYDSDQPTQTNGKENIVYSKWRAILERCTPREYRQKSYIGASVCDEWKSFVNFENWILKYNNFERLHIDKDILYPGNSEYSPSKCVLVPQYVNNIFRRLRKPTNSLPYGVYFDKNVKTNNYFTMKVHPDGKTRRIGKPSSDPFVSHRYWQIGKIETFEYGLSKYLKEDHVDPRVVDRIHDVINKLRREHDNYIETKEIL